MVQETNKISFVFFQACMNILRIFEDNFIDVPIVDTRLTPKRARKHPKGTHSKFELSADDWLLLEKVTTSWNPTCPL